MVTWLKPPLPGRKERSLLSR